jgi:glycosylphosphatidylinositol transamidase (GPIT) subunit GPI8
MVRILLLLTFMHIAMGLNYAENVFIILSGSKFYFNYRHTLNAIQLYGYLKQ